MAETLTFQVQFFPGRVSPILVLPDTFVEFVGVIKSFYLAFEIPINIRCDLGPIDDDITYNHVKQAMKLNNSSIIKIYLSFLIYLQRRKENKQVTFHTLTYDSSVGIDQIFFSRCQQALLCDLGNRKNTFEAFHLMVLLPDVAKKTEFALKCEELLFTRNTNILFYEAPKGYSDYKFNDLENRFRWTHFYTDNNAAVNYISKDKKPIFVNEMKAMEQRFSQMNWNDITFTISFYLTMLKISLDANTCRSEANRRLILNIFFLFASILAGRNFSAEYQITTTDLRLSERVGTGPLDFLIKGGDIDYLAKTLTDPSNYVGGKPLCDLLFQTSGLDEEGKLNTIKSLLSSVDLSPLVTSHVKNSGGDEEMDEEVEGKGSSSVASVEEEFSVCEAKDEDLYDAAQLSSHCPQLIAQMLDVVTYNSKRKFGSTKYIAKGILSSGQTSLFFLLSREENQTPVLTYLGRCNLRVFEQTPGRQTGFTKDEKQMNEVQHFLQVLYIFLTSVDFHPPQMVVGK